jgi:hypothetical protein
MAGGKYRPGEQFVIPPLEFRTVPGRKGDRDVRLEFRWNDSERVSPWWPAVLEIAAAMVDIIADNEDVIHPWPQKGGQYTLDWIKKARIKGWRQAQHDLHLERMQSDERNETELE